MPCFIRKHKLSEIPYQSLILQNCGSWPALAVGEKEKVGFPASIAEGGKEGKKDLVKMLSESACNVCHIVTYW